MQHAAHKDRARAARPTGAPDAGSAVWVKRWSLSVSDAGRRATGAGGPGARAVDPPGPDLEDGTGTADPIGAEPTRMGIPAGIEQELRAIHQALADLRRDVRELRTGRQGAD